MIDAKTLVYYQKFEFIPSALTEFVYWASSTIYANAKSKQFTYDYNTWLSRLSILDLWETDAPIWLFWGWSYGYLSNNMLIAWA